MNVLITGLAGFLGSRLARFLVAARPDLRIWGIDNLSRWGAETNIAILEEIGCQLRHGDLRCQSDLDELPVVDWVIDCAANPSVLAGLQGGTASLVGHNLVGTLNLLEKLRRDGSGLVLISTSRVYSIPALNGLRPEAGEGRFATPEGQPGLAGFSAEGVSEAFSTAAPVSLYGGTKLACEVMALEYGHAFNLPVWINRCGVIAGAGQFGKADQGIFSYWIHSHLAKQPLKFIGYGGSGLQVRDCLHPEDLARLVLAQMGSGSDTSLAKVCNVSGGMPSSMSLHELNAWCNERFGIRDIASDPATRPFDVPWLVLDARLAERQWGWTPQVPMADILEEIAAHARANPGWLAYCR
jgi:CDP-paratose 2-epimerase